MILGLTGKKDSGKDTVAAYLIKKYEFERRAFADPMKESIAALFGIPFNLIDQLKNDDNTVVHLNTGPASGTSLTFRLFLQRYGTEAHRDTFGDDFWLDLTLPMDGFYGGRAIVVSDCRFPNEAQRIRDLGGKIVRIERPVPLMGNLPEHESEIYSSHLLADYMIPNHGSLEDLYHNVDRMLESLLSNE